MILTPDSNGTLPFMVAIYHSHLDTALLLLKPLAMDPANKELFKAEKVEEKKPGSKGLSGAFFGVTTSPFSSMPSPLMSWLFGTVWVIWRCNEWPCSRDSFCSNSLTAASTAGRSAAHRGSAGASGGRNDGHLMRMPSGPPPPRASSLSFLKVSLQ